MESETKHSANCQRVFKNYDLNCPRCQELANGSKPREGWQKQYFAKKQHDDAVRKAEKFLQDHGIEFRAVLVGDDCPMFCEDAAADRDMDKVNVFPRKTHIHGKHYRCTFSAKGRGHLTIDFWNSYRDSEENAYNFGIVRGHCGHGPDCLCETRSAPDGVISGSRDNVYWDKYRGGKPDRSFMYTRSKRERNVPTPYDLLAMIQKYDVGTFHNFCGDFGYNEDSRKAERVYQEVCKEYQKVRKFFTAPELEEARGIN